MQGCAAMRGGVQPGEYHGRVVVSKEGKKNWPPQEPKLAVHLTTQEVLQNILRKIQWTNAVTASGFKTATIG